MRTTLALLAAITAAASYVPKADAAFVVFNDRATFENALSSFATATFNGRDVGFIPSGTSFGSALDPVATIFHTSTAGGESSPEPRIAPVSSTTSPFGKGNFFIGDIGGSSSSGTYTFDFANAPMTNAFGADFNSASLLNFSFNNGETASLAMDSTLGNGTGFFGILADSSFTSVTFGTNGGANEFFRMDDLTRGIGEFAAVPEPASMALFALFGVAGGGATWRRKKKADAAV